jgi:hypothetical protein
MLLSRANLRTGTIAGLAILCKASSVQRAFLPAAIDFSAVPELEFAQTRDR